MYGSDGTYGRVRNARSLPSRQRLRDGVFRDDVAGPIQLCGRRRVPGASAVAEWAEAGGGDQVDGGVQGRGVCERGVEEEEGRMIARRMDGLGVRAVRVDSMMAVVVGERMDRMEMLLVLIWKRIWGLKLFWI